MATEMTTRDQMIDQMVTEFATMLQGCSDEEVPRLYWQRDALLNNVGVLVWRFKGIRVEFTLGTGDNARRYEAVSFVMALETCSGDTMLARTVDTNGGAIGDDDWRFIGEHRKEIPYELNDFYLVTSRHVPGNPRVVSYFVRRFEWLDGSNSLDCQWGGSHLVVRRLP